jgi:4-amino-4-deoxychorismate lyase
VNKTLVNGKFTNLISINDRGFQFGDGVFRTFVSKNGKIPHFGLHYKKLKNDAKIIGIKVPKKDNLLADVLKVCNQSSVRIVKVIVTRGESSRGYLYDRSIEPNVVIQSYDFDHERLNQSQKGVLVESAHFPIDKNIISNIKHLNRILNVLSLADKKVNITDRIFLDTKNRVIEGAFHCIFFRKKTKFVLPSNQESGLVGLSRELLIDYLTKNNIAYDLQSIQHDKVNRFQEMYLMNSVYGVIPVKKYDDISFTINLEIVKELNKNLNLDYEKK